MKREGYNFEPATLFGIDGDKEPNFYLTIGANAVPAVETCLADMFGQDKVLSKPNRQTFFIIPKGRTAAEYKGIPMKDMDEYLMKFDYIADDNLTLLEKLRELTGVYPDASDLENSFAESHDENMICSIEDVQDYLMFKGIERDKAFRIADWVRRGRRLSDSQKQRMWEHGVEYDYIETLDEIDYLPPRAQQIAEQMTKRRLEWYKENYPLEYKEAVNVAEKK